MLYCVTWFVSGMMSARTVDGVILVALYAILCHLVCQWYDVSQDC